MIKLNALIENQQVRDRGDQLVAEVLEQALVTDDGKIAYPVIDGIPVLLDERGISLAQFDGV